MLTKNYTALYNLHNPDHSLPGLMIKSDSSETKHFIYRKSACIVMTSQRKTLT